MDKATLEFIKEITDVMRIKNKEINLWRKRYQEMIDTALFERKKLDEMQFAIDCVFAALNRENDIDSLKARCTAALLGFANLEQQQNIQQINESY